MFRLSRTSVIAWTAVVAVIAALSYALTGVAVPRAAAEDKAPAGPVSKSPPRGGHLYMQTNETKNAIIHYRWAADGTLTPRHLSDSVLSEPGLAVERAVRMVRDGKVVARDGSTISIRFDTICVHGDTPNAAELAAAVRLGLEQSGVEVKAL